MPSKKFNIVFSAIGTITFGQFLKLIFHYPIDAKYYGRCVIAGMVSLLSEPFRWMEGLIYNKKLSKITLPQSPVFILGHWRSGTTLLHNVLCHDPQFAYVTTYQSVFANVFFGSRWLFKSVMKVLIPEKRPSDNVTLSPDFPQEEGFALVNMKSFGFYLFWYFPRFWKFFYNKYMNCSTASEREIVSWQARYKKLIAQTLLEHKRKEFISKNPPNTARVEQLLHMFPNAKFIYIYRNPVVVYLSTLNFFATTLDSLQLHSLKQEELEEMIFELYKKIIADYERQKLMIPKNQLIEIRYEDFIEQPVEKLKLIYATLELNGIEKALPHFISYLDTQKQFEKNKHMPDRILVEKIMRRLVDEMQLYGYKDPGLMEERA